MHCRALCLLPFELFFWTSLRNVWCMFDASTATLLLILDTHPSVGFHCSYDRSHPSQHTHTHSLENAIDCGSFIDDLSDVELWQLADFLLDIKSCDDVRSHCRYITLQHIISCHIMSHHVMSHHVMSHHVMSHHVTLSALLFNAYWGKRWPFHFISTTKLIFHNRIIPLIFFFLAAILSRIHPHTVHSSLSLSPLCLSVLFQNVAGLVSSKSIHHTPQQL